MEISNIKINDAIYYFKDKIARKLIDDCNETSNTALSNSSKAIETSNTALSNSSRAIETSNTALSNSSEAIETSNTALGNSSKALNNSSRAIETSNTALGNSSEALSNSSRAIETSNTALSSVESKSTITIEQKSVELTLNGGVGFIDLGAQPTNVSFISNGGNYKGVSDVLCRTAILSNRYLRAQSTEYPTATFILYYLKITIS